MAKKLYVGNLSYNTTDDSLRAAFAAYGTVTSASVLSDRMTGRSRGFGFVEMENDEEALTAISALDGKDLDGRQIRVNEARPREERPARQGSRY
ncbi:MAG: RNA-binding protein [Patescibacteria group bacterium]